MRLVERIGSFLVLVTLVHLASCGSGGDGKPRPGTRLVAAAYFDADDDGTVNWGDLVIFTFSREVAIQGTPRAETVFTLDPTGSFGAGARVTPGAIPIQLAVEITAGATLQPNGQYGSSPDGSGVNVVDGQFPLIDLLGQPIQPGPDAVDLGGELRPHVAGVAYTDANDNCLADAGDTLGVSFTSPVTFMTSDPAEGFTLPVLGDSLGAGAQFLGGGMPSDVISVTVVLGTGPVLSVAGAFDPLDGSAGAPSGLDVTAIPGLVVDANEPMVDASPRTPPGLDVTAAAPAALWESVGDDQADAGFGASVASAGDVDGDGYSDVIVGAPLYDTTGGDAGKAYLYQGGPLGLASTPAWSASGDDQAGAQFGVSVASAGDVNGDGYDDVILGAWMLDTPNLDAGRAYVYLGSPLGLSPTPDWTSSGDDQPGAQFGGSVATAGDVNGDGFDDIIIGAQDFDTPAGSIDAGKAYVYLGGSSGPSATAAWTAIANNQTGALFGRAVASAGDVNGDGFADVVVGAPLLSQVATDVGKAYVYLGSPSGISPTIAWQSIGNAHSGSRFGWSVGSAGDVDGDGFGDVIVGAHGFSTSNPSAGKAYVFQGGPFGLSQAAAWTSSGEDRARAQFGISTASAGDVNGDGYSDIVVGSHEFDTANPAAGRAFVFLGGPFGPAASWDWASSGDDQANAAFGTSVAGAGDVDGDGFPEVIVGAPQFDTANVDAGKVYVMSPCVP